jgi:hypothetical protein
MKRIRIWGLCLSTALAIGVFGVSPALAATHALPEVGKCAKVPTGTGAYKTANCVTVATGAFGKYEWTAVSATEKQTFTGAGLETILTTAGHATIKCTAANIAGEWTGPKTASVTIEFQACVNATTGEQCQSPTNPQNKSEIKTLPLEGELGFILNEEVEEKPKIIVGLDLKPTPPLTELAMYECTGSSELAHLEGSVIGRIGPFNRMTTVSNLLYHATKAGEQRPESFEGGPTDTLSTTFTEGLTTLGSGASSLTIKTETGTNANRIEIKAREI